MVDSLNACIGERLLCDYAIALKNKGYNAESIKAELDKVKYDIRVIAMIDTLEYLKKGGRISRIVAFAGGLLSVKPILSVVDGEVKVIGKAMGEKKAYALLNNLIKENGGIDVDKPNGAVFSGIGTKNLNNFLTNYPQEWGHEVGIYGLGGTIGTHVGPGAVGVSFFCKN